MRVATYTLTARDGAELTLDAAVEQFSTRGVVVDPGLTEGLPARVKAFKSDQTGTMTVDAGSGELARGALSHKGAITLDLSKEQGPNDEMTVESKTGLRISRL